MEEGLVKYQDAQVVSSKVDGYETKSEILEYSQLLMDSKMIPTSFNTKEKVAVAILQSKELGVDPITGLNNIFVLNGKPTLSAKLQAALVKKAGVRWKTMKDFLYVYSNGTNTPSDPQDKPVDRETVIRFYVPFGNSYLEDDVRFTWKMAVSMKLSEKDNWVKMPTQMMYSRCFSMGVTRNCPEAVCGLYEFSEIADAQNVDYVIDSEGNMVPK